MYWKLLSASMMMGGLAIGGLSIWSSSAGKKPSAVFDEAVWNFGKLGPNEVRLATFRFSNNLLKPLRIAAVVPSCSCVIARRPEEEIAPGQRGTISVVLDTTGYVPPRELNVPVTLRFVDEAVPPVTLVVRGTIIEELSIEPSELRIGKNGSMRLRIQATEALGPERFEALQIRVPSCVGVTERSRIQSVVEFELFGRGWVPKLVPPVEVSWLRILSAEEKEAVEKLGIQLRDKKVIVPLIVWDDDPSPFLSDQSFRIIAVSERSRLREASEIVVRLDETLKKSITIESASVSGNEVHFVALDATGDSVTVWLKEIPAQIVPVTLEINCRLADGRRKDYQHRISYVAHGN